MNIEVWGKTCDLLIAVILKKGLQLKQLINSCNAMAPKLTDITDQTCLENQTLPATKNLHSFEFMVLTSDHQANSTRSFSTKSLQPINPILYYKIISRGPHGDIAEGNTPGLIHGPHDLGGQDRRIHGKVGDIFRIHFLCR